MKIRSGFISNSSSSSFCIKLSDLTEDQIDDIQDHYRHARRLSRDFVGKKDDELYNQQILLRNCYRYDKYASESDEWEVFEYGDHLCGCTSMTNFDMDEFFNAIKVDTKVVNWHNDYYHTNKTTTNFHFYSPEKCFVYTIYRKLPISHQPRHS